MKTRGTAIIKAKGGITDGSAKTGECMPEKTYHFRRNVHSPSSGKLKNTDLFSKTFLKDSLTLSIPPQLIRAPMTSAPTVSSKHVISRQIISHLLPLMEFQSRTEKPGSRRCYN